MVLSGVGATLREERLRRCFSLEDVSNVTRIAARYLEAIENDRPSDLPGVVFTRGFVRQYARFLGIPDDNLLSQLPRVDVDNAALPVAPPKARKPFWTTRKIRSGIVASALTLAFSLVAAAWIYLDLTPIATQVSKAAITAAVQAVENRRSLAARSESSPPAPGVPEVAVPPGPTVSQPEFKADMSAPPISPASAIQVLLTARDNAWVQVIADGKQVFMGLLHANDSREVSGNELVKVVTGNAGGLQISLNGKELDPIGPAGQVRTVKLTAEGLLPGRKSPARIADADPL